MTTMFSMKRFGRALVGAAAIIVGGQAQSAPFSVSQSITYTDPPKAIIAGNNPFLFDFTNLPANALTSVSIRIFGVTDIDSFPDPEGFEYFVDGVSIGSFFGSSFNFDMNFTVGAASVSDGILNVKVVFTDTVNAPADGDFITTSISYRADDGGGNVPEPGTLALVGLAMTGLAMRRPKGIKQIASA